jgi:hypothetical protein
MNDVSDRPLGIVKRKIMRMKTNLKLTVGSVTVLGCYPQSKSNFHSSNHIFNMKKITTKNIVGGLALCLALVLNMSNASAQNVGINATGATPNASAMLDVSASNKGMLIPNVSLQSTTDVTTIASPATSLLVYNTNSSITGTGAGGTGYYYYNGSAWERMSTGSFGPLTGDVTTSGNAATITTDAVDGTNISLASETNGSIMYFNGTHWIQLSPGTAGQVLQTNGAAAPTWVTKSNKFTIPFSNSITVSSPGNNTFWYMVGPGIVGLASTAQSTSPDRTGLATPNNAWYFYQASSPCKLEKIKFTMNNQLINRSFNIVAYKYSTNANGTVFGTGTALTSVGNFTSSGTSFGNTIYTLTGNGTQINEGDVIMLMLQNGNNAAGNVYYSGAVEFSF